MPSRDRKWVKGGVGFTRWWKTKAKECTRWKASKLARYSRKHSICVSSLCSDDSFPNYWVKELEESRAELVNGEWLSDKHVRAANKLLHLQFPTINGLQDPIILYERSRYQSGVQNFVQIINISQSHWVCASNMLLNTLFSSEGTSCSRTANTPVSI